MNDRQKEAQDLYLSWRKLIDKLAGMDINNISECATIRTKAMEIGHQYSKKTGTNIANHRI